MVLTALPSYRLGNENPAVTTQGTAASEFTGLNHGIRCRSMGRRALSLLGLHCPNATPCR
jgi:hypothetical protein